MRVNCLFVLSTIFESFAYAGKHVQQIAPINEHIYNDAEPHNQHIPRDPELSHLRPPEPRGLGDEHTPPTIFIGLSSFRDGHRCGSTVFTAFKAAKNPDLISFGIVDQKTEDEISCVDAYCELAKNDQSNDTTSFKCAHVERIRVDTRSSLSSRGPTLARFYQQQLIGRHDRVVLEYHSSVVKLTLD